MTAAYFRWVRQTRRPEALAIYCAAVLADPPGPRRDAMLASIAQRLCRLAGDHHSPEWREREELA